MLWGLSPRASATFQRANFLPGWKGPFVRWKVGEQEGKARTLVLRGRKV